MNKFFEALSEVLFEYITVNNFNPNHDEKGRFCSGSKESKVKREKPKNIKTYIPHFGRKPNPNFKYDENKIQKLIKDIEPETIKISEIPIFKDDRALKNWVVSEFAKSRKVTILSDNEEILLSKKSAERATYKQRANNIEKNSVYAKIKKTLEKSKYYDFEPKDEEHEKRNIQGQYIYFSKINIETENGIDKYKVLFKIDVPNDEDIPLIYAGHQIEKI